jgi:hypothetical protein
MSIIFGCNAGVYDAVNDAVPGTIGCRSYRDEVNFIPAAWPGKPGSKSLVSLRPHPDDLLSGALDDKIRGLLAVAAPGAELTVWHEAGSLEYPSYITPASVRQMHVHMHNLCAPTIVRYGVIIIGSPASLNDWVPFTPYAMDWYGFDIYMTKHFTNANGAVNHDRLLRRMDDMLALARERTGRRWPQLVVGEANTPDSRRRPEWFTAIAEWLVNHGGRRMHTFWKPGGKVGGAWLPDDTATISALRNLMAKHGGTGLP